MSLQNNIENKIILFLETLTKIGIKKEIILSFIQNNLEVFQDESIDIQDHFFFLFNNDQIYGILLIKEDEYQWSILEDNYFPPLSSFAENEGKKLKNTNYIVEMMIDITNSNKIREVFSLIDEYSIEQKVKLLKTLGLNSNGYHFR